MATPPQLTQLAFANGFDESIESEILDPGKAFSLLQNGRQDLRGGYKKRLGFSALGSSVIGAFNTARATTTRSTGNAIGVTGGRPYVIDGSELAIYDETSATWFSMGRLPEAKVSMRPSSSSWSGNVLSTNADMVVCNSVRALAAITWDPATGMFDVRVGLETLDGLMLRAHESIGHTPSTNYPSIQLGTVGNRIYAVFGDATSANVTMVFTSATTIAVAATTGWSTFGNIITDRVAAGNAQYLFATQSLADRVAIAYVNNSGGTSRLTVKTFDNTGVLETATVNTSSVTPDVMGIEGSNADTLWVAWNEGTTVKLKGLTGNNLASVKATTGSMLTFDGGIPALLINTFQLGIITDPSTAGSGRLIALDNAFTNTHVRHFKTTAGAAVTDSAERKVYGELLSARPFAMGGRFYAVVGAYNTVGYCHVVDFTDTVTNGTFRPVANVLPALAQGVAAHPYVSGTTAAYAVAGKRSAVAATPHIVSLDFAADDRWQAASNGASAVLAGGVLSYVDDSTVNEMGILHPPGGTITSTATAGALTGTYLYVFTFEHVDGNGDWTVSSVSSPITSGAVAAKQIALSIGPLGTTNRQNQSRDESVRIVAYRTTSTGAAPYYYLTDFINDTSALTTYNDNTTDATLTTQRLLLGTGNLPGTNGSSQDRRAPPFVDRVVEYNSMLVAASGADLYYSFQQVIGEGRAFNPLFVVTLPFSSVAALEAMDGTLFAFSDRQIASLAGEPPSDNGASGGFGAPRLLAVDVGSIDGHTLVTEAGIWFRSYRGIELLGRGGGVTWVGEGVARTLASFPVVTRMVLDEKSNLVRISLAESTSGGRASGNGRTLVYDLALQTWISRDDVHGSADHQAAQDACILTVAGEQRYAWLSTGGTVYYERLPTDADAYLDGTTWITRRATTPPFKQSGVQGNQQLNRVQVLERKATDHNLAVSLAYNYESTFRTARTYTAAEINALLSAGYPITQLRHDAHDDAECEAVAVDIQDATPTSGTVGSGEASTWLALSLDITPKPGLFEVPEGAV